MADVHLIPACAPVAPGASAGHPPRFDPRWRTETVLALARGINVHTAYDRLPVLADALEEAGCDLLPLLLHCRHCPTHIRGCWAVNLTLGGPTPVHPPSELVADPVERELFRRIVEEPCGPASRPAYTPPPSHHWTALRMLLGSLAVATVFVLWMTRTGTEFIPTPPATSPAFPTGPEEAESVQRVGETLRQLRDGWPVGPLTDER